jgi:hypothetical protein
MPAMTPDLHGIEAEHDDAGHRVRPVMIDCDDRLTAGFRLTPLRRNLAHRLPPSALIGLGCLGMGGEGTVAIVIVFTP